MTVEQFIYSVNDIDDCYINEYADAEPIKKSKVNGLLIVSAMICCVVLVITHAVKDTERDNDYNLRQKYPVITDSQYALDTPEYDFEDRIKYAPNIANVKIVEQLPDYTVTINNGLANIKDIVFYQYKAIVIDDIGMTNFDVDSDNTITICLPSIFSSSYPALSEGMEVICSIEPAAGPHAGKYLFYDKTFYYVDGDMALAAYESDDSIARISCKKSKLIEQIKKIRSNIKN